MRKLILGALLITMPQLAKAETPIDRACRNFASIPGCTATAKDCGKPSEYSMVADRACYAAGFLHCWPQGLRHKKLEACIDAYMDKHPTHVTVNEHALYEKWRRKVDPYYNSQ